MSELNSGEWIPGDEALAGALTAAAPQPTPVGEASMVVGEELAADAFRRAQPQK